MKIWLPAIRTGSGTDVFTMRLADALTSRGHEAVPQFFAHRYELWPGLLAHVSPPPGTDLIHGNSWSAYAFKRNELPLLVTEHHYIADQAFTPLRGTLQRIYHRSLIQRYVSASYRSADTLIAVSRHTAKAMEGDLKHPVAHIHNWVDLEKFRPIPGLRPTDSSIRCLFVGNPSARKGSDLLPELAKRLGAGYEILCLGGLRKSGRPAPGLIQLPRHPPDEMPELYNSVDIVIVPTRYEAFGYVALEAMACGLPVVGFDSSGTAEICGHGDTALLGPVDDVGTMVRNIQLLGQNPELRHTLGTNGRIRAETRFNEAAAVTRYLDAYEQIVSRSRAGD